MPTGRPLAILLAAWLALVGLWAVLAPLWEAPDAIWHYAFAAHLADGGGLPRSADQAATAAWRQEGSQPPLYYALVALAIAPIERGARPWRDNPHAAVGRAGAGNVNRVLHGPEERWPWRGDALAARAANLVSLALGLVAILATHGAAARLWPGRPRLAAGAAGVLAFTPGFAFHAASISNDIAAAAAGALALWAAAALAAGGASVRRGLALGAAVGAALLAKLSGAFVAAAAAAVALHASRRDRRPGAALAFVAAAAGVAGWWFARNAVLLGDPTGLPLMWAAMPRRAAPPGPGELAALLGGVWKSYWAVFGWFNLPAPAPILAACTALAVVGLAGAAAAAAGGARPDERRGALVCGAFVAALAAGVVAWAGVQHPQGRLLYPAAPALSALIALGWAHAAGRLPGRRPSSADPSAPLDQDGGSLVPAAALAILAAGSLAFVVLPAYRPPATMGPDAFVPVATLSGAGARLALGPAQIRGSGGDAATPAGVAVAPGETLHVALPWRAETPVPADLSVFLHLLDEHGLVLAQRDSMPSGGNAPTSDWPTGRWLIDRHAFTVPPGTPPCVPCRLVAGLYDARSGERLSASIAAGGPTGASVGGATRPAPHGDSGDALDLGPVTVRPAVGSGGVPNPLRARFGDRIELVGYDLPERAVAPGGVLDVALYWRAAARPRADLKVSLQLRRGSETWGQRDEMPDDGRRPTSGWRRGERIVDPQPVPVSPDAPPGAYVLFVKLYDPERGGLPVDGFGHEWALAPVQVIAPAAAGP